ncbi:MAG: hypothetical protein U0T82_11810 [Bacteroidales bacterium]
MKNIIITTLILLFFVSCERENLTGKVWFSGRITEAEDTVCYDSALYLSINFLPFEKVKTSYDLLDSAIYSMSMLVPLNHSTSDKNLLQILSDTIELERGKYLLKKFEMLDKNGKVIYFTPYPEIPENLDSLRMSSDLPRLFDVAKQPDAVSIPVTGN